MPTENELKTVKKNSPMSEEDTKILTKALKRFQITTSAFTNTLDNSKIALDFRTLDQWPTALKAQRENDPDGGRPCLVMDKLGQYVHQVCNDFRQQKTGILVDPVDSGADILVAEVYQDLIRRIENQSTASQAYSWAFQCAVETGLGYWRVITDYEHEKSFNQEIYIKKIPSIFSVAFDPDAIYTDGRDAEYVFITEEMDNEAFEEKYGTEAGQFENNEASVSGWVTTDRTKIAEYFYKEKVDIEIGITKEGFISELDEKSDRSLIIKTKKAQKTVIKWCKITNSRILEKGIWPSKYLPIVRIVGDEHRVPDEGISYQGMIFPAMDAQRIYNYSASSFVETVALSPKAPFVAAAGQIENYKEQWSQANRRNFSVLEYDPVTLEGSLAPPPQRMEMPGVPQGWQFVQNNMLADVQGALGLFNSNLGQQSNERTGAAISSRRVQGEQSQFHFFDNAAMAIEQTGKIIVDLIPKIYDTQKVMKIRGEDGMIKQVFIDPEMAGAVQEKMNEYKDIIGMEVNPKIGSYDVVLSAGPSSATKRDETSKAMFALAQTAPQLMQVGGDLLVKNMNFPGSQELAQRIYRTIPPAITTADPNMSPAVAQLTQQNQMLMQENQVLKAGQEFEMAKLNAQAQADLQGEQLKQQNENMRAQAKLATEKEVAALQESGKIKSARLTSKGEIAEEFVKNSGTFKNNLMSQGFTPEQADSMLGEFNKLLKGELFIDVLKQEKNTDTAIEETKNPINTQPPQEEQFVDSY